MAINTPFNTGFSVGVNTGFQNTTFPGLSKEKTNEIKEKSKQLSNDPYQQTLIQNDLYKKELEKKTHDEFVNSRQQGKMELYKKAQDSKNEIEKKVCTSTERMGTVADILRQYGHNMGKNWDNMEDGELISRFTTKNPSAKGYIDDYLKNCDITETELSNELGIKGKVNVKEGPEETLGQKAADVGVGILQSPGKRGYNIIGQWMDRLGKRGAEQLEGSDLQKRVQNKAIELFGEDEVRAFQEANRKAEEEGTLFNGREQTDIRTPLLGEERANSKYTKAGETIGDIATGIAMTAPIAAATAPIYASSTALGAGALGASEGVLGTAISHLGTQGDLDISGSELALGAGLGAAGGMFTRYLSTLPKNQSDSVRKEAEKYITKSIKPTVKGKQSQGAYNQFIDDTMDVGDFMYKNKGLLQYTDDAGNAVKGELPTNMRETSEVLGNLKKTIYDTYNDIAVQAGEKGAKVDLNKAFQQLDDLEKDIAQNIGNPQTKAIIDRYKNALLEYTDDAGKISIEDAQKITQIYNQKLSAFFKNPNMNDVSENAIVAQLNKWMKDGINDSIDDAFNTAIKNGSSKSAEYQQLKSIYAKIKTIEDEVSKRALVEARKNAKGLTQSIIDSLAGGEFTQAILTANPSQAVKSGIMGAISRYYKYINDPNTNLKKLFELIERTNNPTSTQAFTQGVKETVKEGVKTGLKGVSNPEVLGVANATASQFKEE